MPPAELRCPNETCKARVCAFDQYCGVCGTVLARLRWRTPEEERWHYGDGHVAVHGGAPAARVCFRNEGVVPAALVLCARDIASLPPWVDRAALAEQVLVLQPGAGDTDFEIPLVPALLAPLFASQEGTEGDAPREAHLPYLTNLNELRDGRWTSRPFRLTLIGARRPWLSPTSSFYQFLPVERLAAEGIVHGLELHNETVQALELSEIRITDDPEPAPPGYLRLPASSIFPGRASPEGVRIEAGATWQDSLPLALPDLPETAVGWFSAIVEYSGASADGQERHSMSCRAGGRIGRGPRIALTGSTSTSLTVPSDELDQEHSFKLSNSGQVPVLVESVAILRETDGAWKPAPARDWLSLTGLAAGDVIGPREVRTLAVMLKPSLRQRDEFESFECERRIHIVDDGLTSQAAGPLVLAVYARFGKAEPFTAGIDFGTTNSVVCIGDMQAYALRLEPDLDRNGERIRSLIYFDSNAGGSTDERFRFGDAALASAAIRPENLVRSIKTVVARDPRTKYVFLQRTAGLGEERVEKTPQELLNLFISELRSRAEWGVGDLPAEAYEELDLESGTQIRLSRAVFSHPVAMTDDARRALMEAAHGAGINESVTDVDKFFEQSCIDEPTAAVLAYVAARVSPKPLLDVPAADCERVLCFDMGGGTTDLAAAEVLQMASALADRARETRIIVNLKNTKGARFGGDDLDEMLALMVLAEVRRLSEERKTAIRVDDVERAVRSSSFMGFKAELQRRRAATGRRDLGTSPGWTEDDALVTYKRATDIITLSEEAKRRLSGASESEQIVLPATGWPRQALDGQAATMNYEVQIQRARFEAQVREQTQQQLLPLLDNLVSGAGWDWPDVTTLLFTGQSARVPIIREEVARYVAERRGLDAPPLLRIDPEQADFDPKNCVAIGAAIWGANRGGSQWLEIRNAFRTSLTFTLGTRVGRWNRPVKGLVKGQPLPAEGVVPVEQGAEDLKLFRDEEKQYYAQFHFPEVGQAGEVKVRFETPSECFVVVEGREWPGKVRS
jgi:molecular chaperone DnaK (HSP70)